jgi:hypothetical protein
MILLFAILTLQAAMPLARTHSMASIHFGFSPPSVQNARLPAQPRPKPDSMDALENVLGSR